MSDDETSVRYGAAGSDFAAQCLEKRRILTSALSKINELSAADMITGNKKPVRSYTDGSSVLSPSVTTPGHHRLRIGCYPVCAETLFR